MPILRLRMQPYLINVDKPVGMTSHQVVRYFKQHLPRPLGKIGHLGTLDPFAQGVLLIALGGAQRMNDLIHQWYPKTYRAWGILGVQTPTGDTTVPACWQDSSEHFEQLSKRPLNFFEQQWCQTFSGQYWQVPPIYSAAKHLGRPLHVWAREGVPVLKEPVERDIDELSIVKVDFPRVEFCVTVSSGTYIRTLFEDMAKKIGTYGTLDSLQREGIGPFRLADALPHKGWPQDPGDWQWGKEHLIHHQIPLPRVGSGETGVATLPQWRGDR